MRINLSFIIIIHFLFISISLAEEKCTHTDTQFNCVKFIKNYDGDTLTFKIPNVHPFFGKKLIVRLYGVDTPEIRTKDKCEKKKGRIARNLVKNLLSRAKTISLQPVTAKEKYGRLLAKVTFDKKDLGEILIKNNLAYKYFGKKKHLKDWCK